MTIGQSKTESDREINQAHVLTQLIAERDEIERQIATQVQAMRNNGSSWSVIGAVMGVTKQAAQQRYGDAPVDWGAANRAWAREHGFAFDEAAVGHRPGWSSREP